MIAAFLNYIGRKTVVCVCLLVCIKAIPQFTTQHVRRVWLVVFTAGCPQARCGLILCLCVCVCMCLCCFPHGCHVSWINPRAMCGSLDCVCLGAGTSRCSLCTCVFASVWCMWVIPWVFSRNRWYMPLGNIIHLFSRSSTLTCAYPLDFTFFF